MAFSIDQFDPWLFVEDIFYKFWFMLQTGGRSSIVDSLLVGAENPQQQLQYWFEQMSLLFNF